MSRCYAYIVAYISRLEIGNVVLRPARLEVGHYDTFACLLESSTTSDFADTFGLFLDFPIPTTATGISQGGSMRWLDPGFVGLVLATPEL